MLRKIVFFLTLVLGFSCSNTENDFKISGTIKNKQEIKELYLLQLNGSKTDTLKTIELGNSGDFEFTHSSKTKSYFALGSSKGKITFIAGAKEEIKFQLDEKDFENSFNSTSSATNFIKEYDQKLNTIKNSNNKEERFKLYAELKKEYSAKMKKNPFEIENVYILFSSINGIKIFNYQEDFDLFKILSSALYSMHKENSYVKSLYKDVKHEFALRKYEEKQAAFAKNIEENGNVIDFPNINLPDINGKMKKLSSLKNKVVLLDFWASNVRGAIDRHPEMKEIYRQYKKKGFEIYQVSFDTQLGSWKRAVAYDKLPWISVCDTLGGRSSVIGLFNVNMLPKNYLIDKSGKKIIATNINSIDLRHTLRKLLK